MQLDHLRRYRRDHLVYKLITWVNKQRDNISPPPGQVPQNLRLCQLDIARARRKEHQANVVRAGIKSCLHRWPGRQTAYFHLNRHKDFRRVLAAIATEAQVREDGGLAA